MNQATTAPPQFVWSEPRAARSRRTSAGTSLDLRQFTKFAIEPLEPEAMTTPTGEVEGRFSDAMADLARYSRTEMPVCNGTAIPGPLLCSLSLPSFQTDVVDVVMPLSRRRETRDVPALVGSLFASARLERFEDGMDSNFARGLNDAMRECGEAAINAITALVFSPLTNSDVAAEAIKSVASSGDQKSRSRRESLLESALSHINPGVRDAAVVAISATGWRGTAAALAAAARREVAPELGRQMQRVLTELKAL